MSNNIDIAKKLENIQNSLMRVGEQINELQVLFPVKPAQTTTSSAAPPPTTQPKPQPQPTSNPNTNTKKLTIEDVKAALPAELVPKLDIAYRAAGTVIIVKPITFLGSDNFAKVAQAIKNTLKGEYISAGKESRFEIKTMGGTTA